MHDAASAELKSHLPTPYHTHAGFSLFVHAPDERCDSRYSRFLRSQLQKHTVPVAVRIRYRSSEQRKNNRVQLVGRSVSYSPP